MFPYRRFYGAASNVKGGENPPFTAADFKELYPHFWEENKPLVPDAVLSMFLEFAHASVKQARFRGAWEHCISLFIAHFMTLYLQTAVDPENTSARQVIAAGQTRGLVASKSVDSVSINYDFSTALSDLDGWAAWKLTSYGAQFATMAKMYSKGGMLVP